MIEVARKKSRAQLDRDIAQNLASKGESQLASLFADPNATKVFAREMRHELQKQQTAAATKAAVAARPFTVKRIEGEHRTLFGRYPSETEARAAADRIGGWIEHGGRVIYSA